MRSESDPVAISLSNLIKAGDIGGIIALLADHPGLATERFGNEAQSTTVLHLATDWPGHYSQVHETIAVLVAAGAPVNGRFAGPHRETALHWAASSNDTAAIEALLDAGAELEADGAVHTDGTPLSDAVVFGQWNAARLLVERGASMTLWQAAALGEMAELRRHLSAALPTESDLTNACWHACRAGQVEAVKALVAVGADINWLGHDGLTSREAGLASRNENLVAWLTAS